MRAMRLERLHAPLVSVEMPSPALEPHEVRIAVSACAVCRTDLHVVDGELPHPKLPIVPGHEIVGRVIALGSNAARFRIGDRVGVPWLGWVCGECEFCKRGEENLCPNARFTGYQIDGGFATETIADERFVFALPAAYSDEAAAPLLCAGLIGWRCLKAAGAGERLGLYGFGAAAHIVVQVARAKGQEVLAFVRPGDDKGGFLRAPNGCRLGRQFRCLSARAPRCRDHLRTSRRTGAGRIARGSTGRDGRLRRHSYECHPVIPL